MVGHPNDFCSMQSETFLLISSLILSIPTLVGTFFFMLLLGPFSSSSSFSPLFFSFLSRLYRCVGLEWIERDAYGGVANWLFQYAIRFQPCRQRKVVRVSLWVLFLLLDFFCLLKRKKMDLNVSLKFAKQVYRGEHSSCSWAGIYIYIWSHINSLTELLVLTMN